MNQILNKNRVALMLIVFTIGLSGCRQEVSGRVVDVNDNPIEGVTVSFYSGKGGAMSTMCGGLASFNFEESKVTDENGAYSFGILPVPAIGCSSGNITDALTADKDDYMIGVEKDVKYRPLRTNTPNNVDGAQFTLIGPTTTINFIAFEQEGDPDSTFTSSFPESDIVITANINDELNFEIETLVNPLLESHVTWSLDRDSMEILNLGTFSDSDEFTYYIQPENIAAGTQLTAKLYTRHWHRDESDDLVFAPAVVDTLSWEVVVSVN